MRIIIDTKEDSPEDIRKAAAFLSSISENSKEHHSNIFESSGNSLVDRESENREKDSGAGSNAFASMFGAATSSSGESENPSTDVSSILEQADAQESEESKTSEDDPKIIEY